MRLRVARRNAATAEDHGVVSRFAEIDTGNNAGCVGRGHRFRFPLGREPSFDEIPLEHVDPLQDAAGSAKRGLVSPKDRGPIALTPVQVARFGRRGIFGR